MKITTVLFDLDGTLLPMDQDEFTNGYFGLLMAKIAPKGYEPKKTIDAVWAGTAAMVKNDGSRLNEEAFWTKFAQAFGPEALADQPVFEAFYANEFQRARQFCGYDPLAAQAVEAVKAAGGKVSLAHPYQMGFPDGELEGLVSRLKVWGLDAIECFYPKYTLEQQQFYLHLADKYELHQTGGSDFHGEQVKPDVELAALELELEWLLQA